MKFKMWILYFLLVSFFNGCVTLKTIELERTDMFENGVVRGVEMSLDTLETSDTKEDAIFVLKGFLDVQRMKK